MNTLAGGTGKFKGIRGTLTGSGTTDFKTGTSDTVTEGEYWMEKGSHKNNYCSPQIENAKVVHY